MIGYYSAKVRKKPLYSPFVVLKFVNHFKTKTFTFNFRRNNIDESLLFGKNFITFVKIKYYFLSLKNNYNK